MALKKISSEFRLKTTLTVIREILPGNNYLVVFSGVARPNT